MAPHEQGRRRANGFFAAAGLVLSLMLLRRRFVPAYLLRFVVGFVFGKLLGRHMTFVFYWRPTPEAAGRMAPIPTNAFIPYKG